MNNITFAYPWFFLLLIMLPILWRHYKKTENSVARKMKIPSIRTVGIPQNSGRVKWRHLPIYLRLMALVMMIVALARPQKPIGSSPLSIEGIDIILSLDISGSMLAQDFKPDRLQAAIHVAEDFIKKRTNDRIGLVIFAAESFTQCPLTTDYRVLNTLLNNIQPNILEDGTAIGMGLATAVSRLKNSEAKSKVVILMTDGVNNTGYIDPQTAMEMAKAENIKVYTIGIGRNGSAPYPVPDPFTGRTAYKEMEVQIDENLLKLISKNTGGEYYRAENNKELEQIYHTIDQLEKTKIKVSAYTPKEELFYNFLLMALLILLLEWGVKTIYLKQDL
ncbi:MAG: VWA domain-containing protein [Chitinophagales bacterium]|nr:VWA domain-containing protein [Chitinophagales bacterium]MCZ2392691.1 VWA domain-containing protein [Chitinophagales bacterium]